MSTPTAIIVAGVLIAGAIIATQAFKNKTPVEPDTTVQVPPVTESDHVIGNMDANIAIIEYSDTDCPYCKQFHETLKTTLQQNEDVMWIYRHLPLTTLHPEADTEAHASECVGELGGNSAFWIYLDSLFTLELSQNPESYGVLSDEAVRLGIDRDAFDACMASNRHAENIAQSAAEGRSIGGKGTPFTVFVNRSGDQIPVLGYDTPENVQAIINSLSK